jgi:hypothetical protein
MSDLSHRVLCSWFSSDSGEARAQIDNADWDWEQLFAEASEEAVLPALHSRARELNLHESLPQPVMEFLSSVESLNAERNEAILGELKIAVRLLNEVDIQPVLLKGLAYIVTGVFDTSAARYLADVDLLLPEGRVDEAAQVLMQNGFEVEERDPFAHFRHHHPPLMRPGAVHFEIHYALTMSNTGVLLSAGEVIESSRSVELDGFQVRVPCPEHMMTHLIMHSQLQHPYNERIWPPVRAMYDLVLLQRRFENEIDWSRIQGRFKAAKLYRTLALHILRVQESLGFRPPFRVQLAAELRVAWYRRQILRRFPALRYLDPIYMFSIIIGRRLPMLVRILRTPRGLSRLRDELLKMHIYESFFQDMIKGRGH